MTSPQPPVTLRKQTALRRQTRLLDELARRPDLKDKIRPLLTVSPEITEGKEIDPKDDPFTSCCLVWNPEVPDEFGTGVWIGGKFVLTADHVLTEQLRVSLPLVNAEDRDVGSYIVRKIFRRRDDGRFDFRGADLALLKLDRSPGLDAPPQLANLEAYQEAKKKSHDITLCGFGFSKDPAGASILEGPGIKRAGQGVRILETSNDRQFDPDYEFVGIGTGRHKVDTCEGDSGGPVYFEHQKKQLIVIGITSRGDRGDGCGAGGIYTRIDANLEWIQMHIS